MISWPVIFIQIAFFVCSVGLGVGISLTFHQALSTPYPWMQMTMLVTGGITFTLIGALLIIVAVFALVHGLRYCCSASEEGMKFYFRQVDPPIDEKKAALEAKLRTLNSLNVRI